MAAHYTIIRHSGRAENVKEGHSYWDVLSSVYTEFQSAGGNWDRPKMLLLNANVVVPDKLADLAWEYGQALREAQSKAVASTRELYKPDWVREIEEKTR